MCCLIMENSTYSHKTGILTQIQDIDGSWMTCHYAKISILTHLYEGPIWYPNFGPQYDSLLGIAVISLLVMFRKVVSTLRLRDVSTFWPNFWI